MLRLWHFLIYGRDNHYCKHKWSTTCEYCVIGDIDGKGRLEKIGNKYTLTCDNCGEIKIVKDY